MDIFSRINDVSKKMDIHNTQNVTQQKEIKTPKVEEADENFKNKSKDEIKKELQKIVEELNKVMSNSLNADLRFKFNDKVDELVVQVVDTKNDSVIREFPPKEALKLMEKMRELVGMLFDKKG
jgi:flagellar protein FlaG